MVIYTTPGSYEVKLVVSNIAGTDSLTYTDYILVNNVSYATVTAHLCNVSSYTSPSGLFTWYSSGTYSDIIPNSSGCDSILTIDLSLNYDQFNTIYPYSCVSFTSPSGIVWTIGGTYYDTIPASSGCDSIFTIYLTVYNTDDSVTVSGNTLTSVATGVNYQWLDCNNGYSPVFGEYYQSFTPLIPGNYAVQVSQGMCVDTSSCFLITVTALIDQNEDAYLYPNPAASFVNIYIDLNVNDQVLKIYNVMGSLVKTELLIRDQNEIDLSALENGVYMLEVRSDNYTWNQKLIIQK